jgi:hypothetical protein
MTRYRDEPERLPYAEPSEGSPPPAMGSVGASPPTPTRFPLPPAPDDEAGATSVASAWPDSGLARRDLLRSASAASVLLAAVTGKASAQAAPAAPAKEGAPAPAAGKFLTAAELALVDELSEIIIPTDDHSPGARAAKVAQEIDRRLAEGPAYDEEANDDRRRWREGLGLVDELARRRHGAPFLSVTPAQRLAIVTLMARNERKPVKPEERFFVTLKRGAARAYYASEIGVLQELEYKGNSYLQEFVGHEASTVPLRLKPR